MKEQEQPIPENLRTAMNLLGAFLDQHFTEVAGERMGFALFVFPFGEGGRISYISNSDRADMLATLKEFIAKSEGRYEEAAERSV
jgi:hypothetical protein